MTLLLFILKENYILTMEPRRSVRQFSQYSSQWLAVQWRLRQMTAGLFKQCKAKWLLLGSEARQSCNTTTSFLSVAVVQKVEEVKMRWLRTI